MEVQVTLPNPHSGQKAVLANASRFNTVNCGRRWGKTTMGLELLINVALDEGEPVAWYSPSYKSLSEVWKYFKNTLKGVISHKSEQQKEITLLTGGRIDFWSLDDKEASRGRKYKRVIIDEVAFVRHFEEAWQQTIRPTLTDMSGDAYLFSTPKGMNNHWYKFCQKSDNGWKNFNMPTSSNPFMPPEEIEHARRELPPIIFRQEYEASFENLNSERWFYEWKEDFIIKKDEQIDIDDSVPLWLSLDFNVSPCSAVIFQVFDDNEGGIYFIDEIQADGGTRALVERLKIYKDHPMMLNVTGDSTGHNRDAAAKFTNWQIVIDGLEINKTQLINTSSVNPYHEASRELTAVAMNLDLVYINERCENLIQGIRKAVPNKSGKLFKDDSDNTSHYVDCFRYAIHAQCRNGRTSLVELSDRIRG